MSFYPPFLQSGDTIGIMSPSSSLEKGALDKFIRMLETRGYTINIHPQTYAKYNQSAGTAQEKIDALHDLFKNPDIKAIFAARGGNRAGLMLSGLDYDLIKNNPKPLTGYSDVTALLNAITHKTGMVTYHGPVMTGLSSGAQEEAYLDIALDMISGKTTELKMHDSAVIQTGNASGKLIGGNLSVLTSLMGTPYEPDFDGNILFLEDTGDELSRYDRMLIQLKNANVFANISGLVLGDISTAKDTGSKAFGFTLNEIIGEMTKNTSYPVIYNAPFGHAGKLVTFPVGAQSNLQADHNIIKLCLN